MCRVHKRKVDPDIEEAVNNFALFKGYRPTIELQSLAAPSVSVFVYLPATCEKSIVMEYYGVDVSGFNGGLSLVACYSNRLSTVCSE